MVDSELKTRAERWMAGEVDDASRAELKAVLDSGDEVDLADRMAGPLEFGTAGLRGIIGAGPNRMNRAVIIRTTAGLARYLLANGVNTRNRGVVVGYDGRRMSREFAQETASVLAAAGILAHLFPTLCTTPQSAFATTELSAVAAVMITASHNPPEYNGYKVYWENGAQIIPPHDRGIAAEIDKVGPACEVPRIPIEQALAKRLVRHVPDSVTARYLQRIASLSIHPGGRDGMRIVYTPMHGVGNITARAALAQAGFRDVQSVAEQAEPNGEFPTVRFPNPEEPGALDLAFALARKCNADLILANDPDADRLAVAVPARDKTGFVQLTGNQVGILLAHYLIAEHPNPPPDRITITTIVSSPMLSAIAAHHKVRYAETLTGFKWIANKAMQIEHATGAVFVCGYEEALGYTIGDIVRDKDGVGAAAVFAEMTAWCRSQGRTVLDELERIYRAFGLYVSRQKSVVRKGLDGAAQIAATMTRLRDNPPDAIGGLNVDAVSDYLRRSRHVRNGQTENLTLPASNVLSFSLEGGSRIVARPSGTEPKIKYYFDIRMPVEPAEPFERAERRAVERLDQLEAAFLKLVD
ncbi:MAG: phospho-sugar mutase [Deltaproteobacteria bacterium]|nr:phospho-sugar mutase [Deltaproteobacteria bacterium]